MKKNVPHLLKIVLVQSILILCGFNHGVKALSIDSLNNVINTTEFDTTKVKALNALFQLYEYSDAVKANECLVNAIKLAESKKYYVGLIHSYTYMAYFNEDTGNYSQSLVWQQKALTIAEKINSSKDIAECHQNIANIYLSFNNYQEALNNVEIALKLSQKINDKRGIARASNTIGNINKEWGNYMEAILSFNKSLEVNKELENEKGMAVSYHNIGIINYDIGNFSEALKNDLSALKIHEKLGNKKGISDLYVSIGNIYHKQGNYLEALRNFFASLELCKEMGDKNVSAFNYNNIGNVYRDLGSYDEALKNISLALKIREELGDKSGLATSFNAIGAVYVKQKLYQKAIENFNKAVHLREKIGNKDKLPHSYLSLAAVYLELQDYNKVQKYLDLSLKLATHSNNKEQLKETYDGLSELNKIKGDWKSAYHYNELFVKYRDSLVNHESLLNTIKMQITYEFDKRENVAKVEQEKRDALANEEKARQKMILFFVIGGLIVVIVFSILMFRRWRITQRQKKTIEEQKGIVDVAFHELGIKNKEITDSINYASRIQKALLTSEEYILNTLSVINENKKQNNFFIFYQPKDIVSGDFYWAYNPNLIIESQVAQPINSTIKKGCFYLVVADCTGHGVPGAFMSLLNINFLNENIIERKITQPSEILDKQRSEIIKALNPKGTENSKDGMDCVLFKFDLDLLTLTYSAAYNPLWIVRKDVEENKLVLLEYKGDKMPVGKYSDIENGFTQHSIQLQKRDCVYTFTDGFADQFGGPNGKKFKYKQMEDLLVSINEKDMQEQGEILKSTVNAWMGNLEQVDDILVVGIRI